MKKSFIITMLAVAVFACSRKTVAISNAPMDKPAKNVNQESTVMSQGQTIYITKCGKCHGLKKVSNYSTSDWEPIMKSMARKAKLNEAETQQVTAYVMANARK